MEFLFRKLSVFKRSSRHGNRVNGKKRHGVGYFYAHSPEVTTDLCVRNLFACRQPEEM